MAESKRPRFPNEEAGQYFETLPPTVQEMIVQSDVKITSLEQLKTLAGTITGGEQPV